MISIILLAITIIPLALPFFAVYRLWDSDHSVLKWTIVGLTVFTWLCYEAARNSYKMMETDESYIVELKIWGYISMGMFVINSAVAIYGIVISF